MSGSTMAVKRTKKLKASLRTTYDKGRPTSVSLEHVQCHPRYAKLVDPSYLDCLMEVATVVRDLVHVAPSVVVRHQRLLKAKLHELDALETLQDYWRTDREIESLRRVEAITGTIGRES